MLYDVYSQRNAEEILDDMLATVDDKMDKREGSIIYDMQAPAALEIEMLGFELDAILEMGWTDSADGDFLERRCAEMGVDRKAGEYAKGIVKIVAPPGTEIDAGTPVYAGDKVYTVDADLEIPETGEATAEVTASDVGVEYNIMSREVTSADIENLISITNELPFDSGVDRESDDALKERYYLRVRKPITSGNIYHYESLALEIKGVGAAKVIPLHAGPGTVKIILSAETGEAVTQDVVDAVKAHIVAQQIIGADATVISVVTLPIAVSATIALEEGFTIDNVIAGAKESLRAYFAEATREGTVRYAQVGNALIDTPGVLDYEALTINGDTRNITVSDEQSAAVGEVTLIAQQ